MGILFYSCSHINTESRGYYVELNSFRHGIIPLEMEISVQEYPQKTYKESSIQRGKKIYQASCTQCHGNNGEGNGEYAIKKNLKPKSLKKLAKEVPNFSFFMLVSQAKSNMPGWEKKFTEEEIHDLEGYIKSFNK